MSIPSLQPLITEYLVKLCKRRAFWSLNEDILKIIDSDYQYAVSIKEDTAYPCLHSSKTTKEQDLYSVSREPQYAVSKIVGGANNDPSVLNHSSLFDNFLDDITPVVPYEVNGVTFEKGYYLADEIYPQWATFFKSFTAARDKKNAVFKRRQESA
ncbi:ALP1-like protein isoform X1 [Tanacetum coccineum]